jgi:hypothetical protein
MSDDMDLGYTAVDLLLDLLSQVVTALHRPIPRYQDMHGDKTSRRSRAGAHGVEFHALGFEHL